MYDFLFGLSFIVINLFFFWRKLFQNFKKFKIIQSFQRLTSLKNKKRFNMFFNVYFFIIIIKVKVKSNQECYEKVKKSCNS